MKNIILSFLYYIALGIALFIVLYLYSDDYNFPWSTHDEGLKYLHFLLTEPFPLAISLFATFGISDIEWRKVRLVRQLLILFVFLATTVYMMADGGHLGHTKFKQPSRNSTPLSIRGENITMRRYGVKRWFRHLESTLIISSCMSLN